MVSIRVLGALGSRHSPRRFASLSAARATAQQSLDAGLADEDVDKLPLPSADRFQAQTDCAGSR